MKAKLAMSSCLFEKIKKNSKTKAGILCMNNPINICQKLFPDSNTSKENDIRKQTNTIPKIFGNLSIIFPPFLTISKIIQSYYKDSEESKSI